MEPNKLLFFYIESGYEVKITTHDSQKGLMLRLNGSEHASVYNGRYQFITNPHFDLEYVQVHLNAMSHLQRLYLEMYQNV